MTRKARVFYRAKGGRPNKRIFTLIDHDPAPTIEKVNIENSLVICER